MEYSEGVARHFANPANAGVLEGPDVVAGKAGDRAQGAQVVFHARIVDERIAAIRFQAYGCPHTLAACSLVTERLEGLQVQALRELRPEELAAPLEIPVEKTGRLLIIEDALRNCWAAWDNR